MKKNRNEFDRIRDFFRPLARGNPAALEMRDDAALLEFSAGAQLVVSADMLAEGVHFRREDPLDLVARKSLRVNLSDLAGKGARPLGYFMCLCWPRRLSGEEGMRRFADGLAVDGERFGVPLLGGDLIAGGEMSIAVTVLGRAPEGGMPRRSGGRAGEDVYVSGCLGDSALGLLLLEGRGSGVSAEGREYLEGRYLLPEPRLGLGAALASVVGASMDVSDGLLADLRHVCTASGAGALVREAELPVSAAARDMIGEDAGLWDCVLAGGDEYELLFSAAPEARGEVAAIGRREGVALTRIGALTAESGVRLEDGSGGVRVAPEGGGYRHF